MSLLPLREKDRMRVVAPLNTAILVPLCALRTIMVSQGKERLWGL